MLPQQLLEENLDLIDRTARRICGRAGVTGADADDFAANVRLALIEKDYAILRSWEQRSSLATFLAVIVQRLFADEYERGHGRWRPSAEAKRRGSVAVMIENLVCRARRSIDEALPVVRELEPGITRERVAAIADALPERTRRPRAVELDDVVAESVAGPGSADERVVAAETRHMAERTEQIVRRTFDAFAVEDRMLIRLHFAQGMSLADVARMLGVPQRPLYRRLESLLKQLRRALTNAGIDASALAGAIGIDFGLHENGKNETDVRTTSMEGP